MRVCFREKKTWLDSLAVSENVSPPYRVQDLSTTYYLLSAKSVTPSTYRAERDWTK
jgi:hypothetical protein